MQRAAEAVRHQDDDRRQEHRLRAALRRPDPVRHGVHARPRLLRGEVPARRAATRAMISMQGGHFVPIPFEQMLDPNTGPHARPHGRHPLDALRDRAALHDPAAARRLRGSARAREVRRDRRAARCRSSASEFEYLVNDEPPPVVFDPELGFVEQGEDHADPAPGGRRPGGSRHAETAPKACGCDATTGASVASGWPRVGSRRGSHGRAVPPAAEASCQAR